MSTTLRMADGDILINSAGRAETVTGADKCAQDIAEVLMTPLQNGYGSELADIDVPEPVRTFVGKGIVSKKVDEALQRLIRLQRADLQSTPDERIDRVERIVVEQIGATDFVFWVSAFVEDSTVVPEQLLGVSLRHQVSAKLYETVQEQIATAADR